MCSTWLEHGTKKNSESPMGIEPMASQIPVGMVEKMVCLFVVQPPHRLFLLDKDLQLTLPDTSAGKADFSRHIFLTHVPPIQQPTIDNSHPNTIKYNMHVLFCWPVTDPIQGKQNVAQVDTTHVTVVLYNHTFNVNEPPLFLRPTPCLGSKIISNIVRNHLDQTIVEPPKNSFTRVSLDNIIKGTMAFLLRMLSCTFYANRLEGGDSPEGILFKQFIRAIEEKKLLKNTLWLTFLGSVRVKRASSKTTIMTSQIFISDNFSEHSTIEKA